MPEKFDLPVLDEAAQKAVAELPQNIRSIMFNAFGEPLVYGIDTETNIDFVFHGDADYKGVPVVNGQVAPGTLILDAAEAQWVMACWTSAEQVRRAKAPVRA